MGKGSQKKILRVSATPEDIRKSYGLLSKFYALLEGTFEKGVRGKGLELLSVKEGESVIPRVSCNEKVDSSAVRTVAIGFMGAVAGLVLGIVLGKAVGRRSREGGEAGYKFAKWVTGYIESNV